MKNKKLKKFLIILFTILFIITVISVTIHFFKTKYRKIYNMSSEIVFEETYLYDFNEFIIDSTMCDIDIKQSSDNNIKVVFKGDKDNLKVIEKNNKLYVDIVEKNFIYLDFYTELFKLEIYLPSNYNKVIRIDNEYGNVRIDEFTEANFEINQEYGILKLLDSAFVTIHNEHSNIKIESSDKVRIELDDGNINIKDVGGIYIESEYSNINIDSVLNYIKIKNENGNININNLNLADNSYIYNEYGNINIDLINEIYIKSKIKRGNKTIKNNYKDSDIELKLENSFGDININN